MVGACSMVNSEGLGGWQWDINILMIPNVDLTSYDVFLLLVTMFFMLQVTLQVKLFNFAGHPFRSNHPTNCKASE